MAKSNYPTLLVLTSLFFTFASFNIQAQCGSRYIDYVFASADTLQNIVFTTTAGGTANDTLLLDVYLPHGDTATNRHLIIWAHGGAFFEGTKNDNDIQYLCTSFAKRGYVCASINYRLVGSVLLLYDSLVALDEIVKADDDMKSSIRFFRKNFSLGNTYGIDTSYIFGAGSSAGAIMIDFAATIDSINEVFSTLQTAIQNNGGIEGSSGNDGYSSNVKAVASLAGGISDLSWIGPGTVPMVFCQGTSDPIIPYNCADVFNGYTGGLVPGLFRLCGSQPMEQQCATNNVTTSLMAFANQGHVPWSSHADIMNTTDSAVAQFFYHLNCTESGVKNIPTATSLNVFPNPSNDELHIQYAGENEMVAYTIFDLSGQVISKGAMNSNEQTISVKNFSRGIYFLKVTLANSSIETQKILLIN